MSVDHKPHPKPVQYVQIALVLGALTAIEVALILHRRRSGRVY